MSELFTLIPKDPKWEPESFLQKTNGGLSYLVSQIPENFPGDVLIGDTPLVDRVQDILVHDQKTIAVAESCTGGLLGGKITSIAGSSRIFSGGIISYSNVAKRKLLGVHETTLEKYGAVSSPVAMVMAQGVKMALEADYGLSITGIAGPGGGSLEKPVGTVWFGLSGPGGEMSTMRLFPGDRENIRWLSVHFALYLLLNEMDSLDKAEKHKG